MMLIEQLFFNYLPVIILGYIFYVILIQNTRKKKYTKVINKRLGKVVIPHLACAFTFYERLTGLLNHAHLQIDEALLIEPVSRIHMKGMKFSIDVLFLDASNKIIHILENIPPEEPTRIFPKKQYTYKGTRKVLELAAGAAKIHDFRVGDTVEFT